MKPAKVNLNQNSHLRKIFIRFSLVLISISKIYSQEIERPNAQPYTVEATFEKLKKKYSFIQPLNLEFPKNIKVKKDLKYKTRNGKSLLADIYFPENSSQKDPAIILVHGGGWISGSKENEKFLAQELASKGYIAMAINYSLSDFAKYPAAVEDIQDALKFLKSIIKNLALIKRKLQLEETQPEHNWQLWLASKIKFRPLSISMESFHSSIPNRRKELMRLIGLELLNPKISNSGKMLHLWNMSGIIRLQHCLSTVLSRDFTLEETI
jgi:hypothetical protein